MGPFENALERLGIKLPPPPAPVASYVPCMRAGNLLFISGQLPSKEGKVVFEGAIPTALTIEQGAEAAKLCAINAIAALLAPGLTQQTGAPRTCARHSLGRHLDRPEAS